MKKILLSCLLTLTFAIPTMAYDFEVDGIYYNITSSSTVEVTYPNDDGYGYDVKYDYEGSITIPDEVSYSGGTYAVTSIGQGAFGYCYDLMSVTIGNYVTTIGDSAFFRSYGLNTVVLGAAVEEIEDRAFYECYSLMSITSLNPEPPTIDGEALNAFNRVYGKLYVPTGYETAYASARTWKTIQNVEGIDPTGIQNIKAQTKSTADAEVVGYYTIDGKHLNTPQNGVNILNYSDGTTKKILRK